MSYTAMAYTAMAVVVMAHLVIAYVVMVYTSMTYVGTRIVIGLYCYGVYSYGQVRSRPKDTGLQAGLAPPLVEKVVPSAVVLCVVCCVALVGRGQGRAAMVPFVCVRACVCVYARACTCACGCECRRGCGSVHARIHMCSILRARACGVCEHVCMHVFCAHVHAYMQGELGGILKDLGFAKEQVWKL